MGSCHRGFWHFTMSASGRHPEGQDKDIQFKQAVEENIRIYTGPIMCRTGDSAQNAELSPRSPPA
ncbi:MAG: hypothetical protein GX680_09435 [Bacteroidales bacterium]|nr:hypothetical protein [Bacteroidales bacterium]